MNRIRTGKPLFGQMVVLETPGYSDPDKYRIIGMARLLHSNEITTSVGRRIDLSGLGVISRLKYQFWRLPR